MKRFHVNQNEVISKIPSLLHNFRSKHEVLKTGTQPMVQANGSYDLDRNLRHPPGWVHLYSSSLAMLPILLKNNLCHLSFDCWVASWCLPLCDVVIVPRFFLHATQRHQLLHFFHMNFLTGGCFVLPCHTMSPAWGC